MKLLCLGDSLTYGYDVRPAERWTALVAAKGEIQIDNKGQCGDTTAGMVFRLHQLDLIGYDAFFIMGGSNDILLDREFSSICRNIEALVSRLKGTDKPIYLGIPPLTKLESAYYGWQEMADVDRHNAVLRQYRQWILNYGSREGCTIIDFFRILEEAEQAGGQSLYSDGVHPSADGYALFAEAVLKSLSTDG